MSALAAVLSAHPQAASEEVVDRMLSAMAARGNAVRATWSAPGVTLAVVRHGWEESRSYAGPATVFRSGPCAVVADATLYYRPTLRRRLDAAGVSCPSDAPGALILAAYEAWGPECAAALEGDFAFILWDARSGRLVCGRDFAGRRPLFHASSSGALIAASTIGGVASHPSCPQDLSLGELAAAAAGLPPHTEATCLAAIRSIPAGSVVSLWPRAQRRRKQVWSAPSFEGASPLPFTQAAEALRETLGCAVAERIDPDAPTSVWMSGGYDSTAVAGLAAAGPGRGRLASVSIGYPPGDPGREDETITHVAGFLGIPVHWIRSGEVPVLDAPEEGAALRDEPFAHAFEAWNRALARGSRAVGTRVALDGMGGDQLFQVSPIRLADLLATGRFVALARELAGGALMGGGRRGFLHWAIAPLLPPGLSRRLGEGRGHLDGGVPPWIREDAVRRYGLGERARVRPQRRRGESRAAHETRWYLTSPYFPKVFAVQAELALEAGVELRSPLYDARVIALAAGRPVEERARGGERKRLLRAALAGLLPESVLAHRPHGTGVTSGYFSAGLRAALPSLSERVLGDLRLEALGIVDGPALRRAVDALLAGGAPEGVGVGVFLTLQSELWLRARERVLRTGLEVVRAHVG